MSTVSHSAERLLLGTAGHVAKGHTVSRACRPGPPTLQLETPQDDPRAPSDEHIVCGGTANTQRALWIGQAGKWGPPEGQGAVGGEHARAGGPAGSTGVAVRSASAEAGGAGSSVGSTQSGLTVTTRKR